MNVQVTINGVSSTLLKSAKGYALDLAAFVIGVVCDRAARGRGPSAQDMTGELNAARFLIRELSAERDALRSCNERLQSELDDYRAMHEMQHGPTVELPDPGLTVETFPVKHRHSIN